MTQSDSKLGVVIGGGNGIGASTSRLMVERGWRVAVVELNRDLGEEISQELGCGLYEADVSDMGRMEVVAAAIEKDHGPVSSLVVSAAMFQDKHTPLDFSIDLYRKILDVNIAGTFLANRIFGSMMAARGRGSIVNIASDSAIGGPLHSYGPSKAAVVTLTRNLAVQWGRSGVRVNSVSPSATQTKRVLQRAPGRHAANVDELFALGRRVQPNEVAEAVEFLASDRASAITGVDLLVDAGLYPATRWGIYGGVPASVDQSGLR